MQAAQRYLAAARSSQSNSSIRNGTETKVSMKTSSTTPSELSSHESLDGTLNGPKLVHPINKTKGPISKDESATSDYNGSDEFEDGSPAKSSFLEVLEHACKSRAESQSKLIESLSRYNDYVDPDDNNRIQQIKDTIQNSITGHAAKPRQRFGRRSSLGAGPGSQHTRSTEDSERLERSRAVDSLRRSDHRRSDHIRSDHRRVSSIDESSLTSAGSASIDFPRKVPGRVVSGSVLEISLNGLSASFLKNDLSLNYSAGTLLLQNTPRTEEARKRFQEQKMDQMVESLVWFSFHTPRAVLEDLIQQEMSIWKGGEIPTVVASGPLDIDVLDEGNASIRSLDSRLEPPYTVQKAVTVEDTLPIALPSAVSREAALLFVDMSGFTKLSTMLDVESLSRVINSYFDMILSEVIHHGGDILKFAGDAFFAEWKVPKSEEEDDIDSKASQNLNPLASLNASLASLNEMIIDDDDDDVPALATCVLAAAKCATAIVDKFSDYQVSQPGAPEAMLNVHCGIGVGNLVGLHVSDYKEGHEEAAEETRREFLVLGEAIDQVATAADVATDGEVMASPQAILHLSACCDIPRDLRLSSGPICIAARGHSYLQLDKRKNSPLPTALQPYESLRFHCRSLSPEALARLHLQMALYVHPVIRASELSMSVAIQSGKIDRPTEVLESRHREEAELRSVFTLFISPIVAPRITGLLEVDDELYKSLANIMNVTCRELDRYSGHLRQFIVDDKGVVLLATFGLRGSTFPNMVANNALPATFAIHNALKNELKVETRIGATFGKVYCGTVGGLRRHEFAVMGAPVNLAARLMGSKVNRGILVDEAVKEQAGNGFAFRSLPPVTAKGYDQPVPILEPLHAVSSSSKKKSLYPFVGRLSEREKVLSLASAIGTGASQRAMVFLTGESGTGKTALVSAIMDEINEKFMAESKRIVSTKASSTETEQRNPFSIFRKILLNIVREHGAWDHNTEDQSETGRSSIFGSSRRSGRFRSNKVTNQASGTYRATTTDLNDDDSKKSLPQTTRSSHSSSLRQTRFGKVSSPTKGLTTRSTHGSMPLSQSIHRVAKERPSFRPSPDDDLTECSHNTEQSRQLEEVPYFERLCWACEKLDYPLQYIDLVGSQFLSLDGAKPVSQVDGHVPSMNEIVDFLVEVFICLTESTDIVVVSIDNFQWVDSFSWKIFKKLGEKGQHLLLLGAMRSHDKQAMRRLSNAAAHQQTQMLGQMTEIVLSSFETSDIRVLASHILGFLSSQISDSICSDIFQRSGGLPVFVLQVLENIKRAKTLVLNDDGEVTWTKEGLKEKRALSSNQGGAVMEETFLSRFDVLHLQVRKVLQTCAVIGLTFSIRELMQVHPEMEKLELENAIAMAVEEMIIVEQEGDDGVGQLDLDGSVESIHSMSARTSQTSVEKLFEFSHTMWRKSVLTTMLKERKIELHRLIAESMEKQEYCSLEESDISKLLTLFDHWKSCGDFFKLAPLALVIGSRLEEWDLFAQSLELYTDALNLSFESVDKVEEEETVNQDWLQVSASPQILDSILRLHIRIGLCHQRLGNEWESITTFEDAHQILDSASRLPPLCVNLKMPILSSLCVLQLETGTQRVDNSVEHRNLLLRFIREARNENNPVHIGRAYSLHALFHARNGQLALAIDEVRTLQVNYDIQQHSFDMISEYGRDFALECLSESVQWMYLLGQHDEAEERADRIVSEYLRLIDSSDGESMMAILLPIFNVFKLIGRAKDAEWLLKKYIINPAHEQGMHCEFWIPLFNPLAYLLEVVVMEETEAYDEEVMDAMSKWVLDDENSDNFDVDLEYKAFTFMGELCWRLANYQDEDSDTRKRLTEKARALLTPVVQYPHNEIFLKNTAEALIEAL